MSEVINNVDFFDRFQRELERVKDMYNLPDISKALIVWFSRNYLHLGYDDDIVERISDGSNDEGLDAVLVDEPSKHIYFISATTVNTYDHTNRNLPETDLKITFSGFSLVTAGDYRGKINPILEGLVKEYHELLNSGDVYKVSIIFVHENKRPVSTKYFDEFHLRFPTVEVDFFSFDRLYDAYNGYLIYQEPAPDKISLDVLGKILRTEGDPKSVIFTVNGKSLANIFLVHGTRIFQRNVRYFLASRSKRSINSQIEATASHPEKSKRFWYFNNGITVICSKIEIPPNDKLVILSKMQIINGAQTTYSIYNAFTKDTLQDSTTVLMKVIESQDNDFIDDVTLYTNSQNPVNLRDLSSRDLVQTEIQKVFKTYKYFYERKRGEFNALFPTDEIREKEFGQDWKRRVISNEKVAQAYMSLFLNKPSQAKAQRGKIFDKSEGGYYNDIFNNSTIVERLLLAYKLLYFIEKESKEYSAEYYEAATLPEPERNEIYRYDYLLHSDFFILNLFKDFLENESHDLSRGDCISLLKMLEEGDSFIEELYKTIKDLIVGFVNQRMNEDETYYHAKFFKSETSIGLLRQYLRTQQNLDFIQVF